MFALIINPAKVVNLGLITFSLQSVLALDGSVSKSFLVSLFWLLSL